MLVTAGISTHTNELVFISKTKISVPEPSGLTYHNGRLFAISDATPFMYQLSLDGELEKKFFVKKEDLEGISYIEKTKEFVLISESKRSIIYYSLYDGIGKSYKLKGKQKSENKGLEGVCYNARKKSLYVLNEANPKELLEISPKGKIKQSYDLNFSKDVSGIVYDSKLDVYWVLSDESQALFKVSNKGKELQKFPLSIKKPEGIALDINRRLYIVSDLKSELFVYQLK